MGNFSGRDRQVEVMRRVPAVLTFPSETPAASVRLKYELQQERFIASHMNILRIRCKNKVKLYYNVTMIPKITEVRYIGKYIF